MRQILCDKCNQVIHHDRVFVWHQSTPGDDHNNHFDLCVTCNATVVDLIQLQMVNEL